MTTIVGIYAKKDKSIILASDLSATRTHWTPQGDIAYRQQTKEETQKIHVDNDRKIALATTGTVDTGYLDFLESILKGEINIERAIKRTYFPQFKRLNEERWGGMVPDEDRNSLLMATRFEDNPNLYSCWPLGKVEQIPFTSIGSGSQYAREYLMRHGEQIYSGLPLLDCIDLAVGSLEEASRDLYTAGLDLVVVTPKGIKEFGDDIKKSLDSTKKKSIRKIKKYFDQGTN